VIELRVPPLRERREDIPKLAARVLERLALSGGNPPARLAPEALKALLSYDFPGNVRELENVLERAVAMCENGNITADDLRLSQRSAAPIGAEGGMISESARGYATPSTPMSYPPPPPSNAGFDRGDDEFAGDLAAAVAETERAAIMKALEATRWNRTAAAKQLGLTLRQLRYRLEKLGIE
jgi:two-component system response regulator PilR (NtrC family)